MKSTRIVMKLVRNSEPEYSHLIILRNFEFWPKFLVPYKKDKYRLATWANEIFTGLLSGGMIEPVKHVCS